jgi:Fur family iron response transcriptional regulator
MQYQGVFMNLPRTTAVNMAEASDRSPPLAEGARLTGCPWHDVKMMLRRVGLRPTRQRMALGWMLFGKGDRHITAEMLYEEATKAKVPVSLATIYNTLHQFTDVGLLRQVAVDGSKTYFDTNATQHHHFFVEGENALLDIADSDVVLGRTPVPPDGYEITRIDVVVRLRRKPR